MHIPGCKGGLEIGRGDAASEINVSNQRDRAIFSQICLCVAPVGIPLIELLNRNGSFGVQAAIELNGRAVLAP